MVRATPAWTNTETADWTAGSRVRQTKLLQQVFQNIEFLAQGHDHSGDPGDGSTLPTADPKAIAFYAIRGGPFA